MLLPYLEPGRLEAGCDEAGRGCLSGPVVAAAVILPPDFRHPLLNDSKKLQEKTRNTLREVIEKEAISFAIARVEAEIIDQINILQASFRAMHLAVDQLLVKPEVLLIDGNRFKSYPGIPHHCLVKGDARYASIAAASILAKTYRDEIMYTLDQQYPAYQWRQNKGYPTRAHREAIRQHGLTPLHRQSFTCLPELPSLDFTNNPE